MATVNSTMATSGMNMNQLVATRLRQRSHHSPRGAATGAPSSGPSASIGPSPAAGEGACAGSPPAALADPDASGGSMAARRLARSRSKNGMGGIDG
jgi:hypothetical protein